LMRSVIVGAVGEQALIGMAPGPHMPCSATAPGERFR
jgi:hypothetical protein